MCSPMRNGPAVFLLRRWAMSAITWMVLPGGSECITQLSICMYNSNPNLGPFHLQGFRWFHFPTARWATVVPQADTASIDHHLNWLAAVTVGGRWPRHCYCYYYSGDALLPFRPHRLCALHCLLQIGALSCIFLLVNLLCCVPSLPNQTVKDSLLHYV